MSAALGKGFLIFGPFGSSAFVHGSANGIGGFRPIRQVYALKNAKTQEIWIKGLWLVCRFSKSYISSKSSTVLGKMDRNATKFRSIQWKIELPNLDPNMHEINCSKMFPTILVNLFLDGVVKIFPLSTRHVSAKNRMSKSAVPIDLKIFCPATFWL